MNSSHYGTVCDSIDECASSSLPQGVNESLVAAGVLPSNVFTTYVPGAFELPVTAKLLAASKRVDVIVNIGR